MGGEGGPILSSASPPSPTEWGGRGRGRLRLEMGVWASGAQVLGVIDPTVLCPLSPFFSTLFFTGPYGTPCLSSLSLNGSFTFFL